MTERRLEELSREECIDLLKTHAIGRISIVDEGFPRIFPVNYRVTETEVGPWITIRTRRDNVIDHVGANVCLEIDGVNETQREGWSVLVCGRLDGLMIDSPKLAETFQSDPWIAKKRDSWLVIEPLKVTGRSLHVRRRAGHWARASG